MSVLFYGTGRAAAPSRICFSPSVTISNLQTCIHACTSPHLKQERVSRESFRGVGPLTFQGAEGSIRLPPGEA